MKTLLVLVLLPLCAVSQYRDKDPQLQALTFAPSNYDQLRNNVIYYSSWSSENAVKENKVHTVTTNLISKRGKSEAIETKTFDDQGRVIQRKSKYAITTHSYTDTLLVETITTKRKKEMKNTYQYDEHDRMIGSERFKNGKLVSKYRFEYFDGFKRSLVEQTVFKRKATVYTLKTEYDVLLKKPTSVVYLVDGKLEKTWNYDCKEEGELVKKSTEEISSQCSFEQQNNDGSYSKFVRSIENGKTYLLQSDYGADSSFLAFRKFYNDTVLIEKQLNTEDMITVERYSEKGKLMVKYDYQMDEKGNRVAYHAYSRRNKLVYFEQLTYNEQNLITESKLGEKWKHTFEYTFHSN